MSDATMAVGGTSPAPETESPEPMTQRRVLGLAVPIIGEGLLQTLLGVVDTLMVASLGAAALAGVGIASEFVFFMISVFSAVSVGATVLVSHAIGARDPARADRLARQVVVWGLVVAIPLTLLGNVLAEPLIGIFGADPEVTAEGTTYLRITSAGMVVMVLIFVLGGVLKGAGDSRTPLYASFIANIVNGVASYALIFGEAGLPRLDVAGSAWGTVIGRGTGAAILLWFLVSGRRRVSLAGRHGWRLERPIAAELAHIGVPTAIERMVTNVGITTMVLIVATIGTAALAAQQVLFTMFAMALLPGIGFSTAATALVGQSLGARDIGAAREAARISMRWSLGAMLAAAAIFIVFARPILRAFTDDAAVVDHGDGALVAMALTLPVLAYQFVYGGGLRALGDARTPMVTNIAATWLGVVLGWAGVMWLDGGLTMVWAAQVVTSPIMLLALPVFRRKLVDRETQIARIVHECHRHQRQEP